ncbi:hypothetical protein QVD17_24902 [Tagetes erecta]|uniref:Uncharacterized protein n=1 Tax=Tagetes erecta TaxID=13708 RepID=A0AAD8KIE5_TARER|nr:hypothetical protein QVD17_24902 [Tagetes erecta]
MVVVKKMKMTMADNLISIKVTMKLGFAGRGFRLMVRGFAVRDFKSMKIDECDGDSSGGVGVGLQLNANGVMVVESSEQ